VRGYIHITAQCTNLDLVAEATGTCMHWPLCKHIRKTFCAKSTNEKKWKNTHPVSFETSITSVTRLTRLTTLTRGTGRSISTRGTLNAPFSSELVIQTILTTSNIPIIGNLRPKLLADIPTIFLVSNKRQCRRTPYPTWNGQFLKNSCPKYWYIKVKYPMETPVKPSHHGI
jgi:hypothetical protein